MERRRLCSDGRKSNACEILFLQRFPHSHSPFIEIIRDEEGKGREECAATRHGELVFYFLIHIKYQCMMGALLRSLHLRDPPKNYESPSAQPEHSVHSSREAKVCECSHEDGSVST